MLPYKCRRLALTDAPWKAGICIYHTVGTFNADALYKAGTYCITGIFDKGKIWWIG